MKKLSILFIGLLLVAGFASAVDFAPSVTVGGSASVTFGVDLNTNQTGFKNEFTSTLAIRFVAKQSVSKGGDDGLYGEIKITDLEATAWTLTPGSVTGTIYIDPIQIKIYSAPSFAIDKATVVQTGNANVAVGLTPNAGGIQGITVTIPVDPITLALKLASNGTWVENVDNDYAVGADVTLKVSPITLAVGATYGFTTDAQTFGVGVRADVALPVLYGLDIWVASDINMPDGGDLAWDARFNAAVNLTEKNADGVAGNVALAAYVIPDGDDMDLDLKLTVGEPKAGGFMEMLYFTLGVELFNVLVDPMIWNVDLSGGYDTGAVDPYFAVGYGSDEILNLQVGVRLKAGLTGIDNTTITLDYTTPDVETDNGYFTVKTTIAY